MVRRTRSMKVDPLFHDFCKNMGIASRVTKKLAEERTILSELVSNDKFKKEMEKFYKEFKGFNL